MFETGLISYVSDRGNAYDIWLYDPCDGRHTQLTEGLADVFSIPYWSSDSHRIAFVGRYRIIYVFDLLTGQIAEIDQLAEGEIHTLDWSPDSRRLAYTKQEQIILYDIISHEVQSFTQPGASDVQWFPDGIDILFQAPDAASISQLYRMRTDTAEKDQITRNEEGRLNYVRLSPDGQFALYTTPGASISIIHTVDLATGQVFEVRGGPLARNYYPEWSPNSTRIAYSANAFEENGYFSLIRIAERKGGKDRTWAISDCFATPVTWSPDSRKVVYLSGCNDAPFGSEMWYIDLNHPVPIQLMSSIRITVAKWSPTPIQLSRRTYTNLVYNVTLQYPMNWREVSSERYEGEDGFFQISAISAGLHIDKVCQNEALHPLMPYGSQPRIIQTRIQNQEACFIFPSTNQPPEMREQAALIVRYPRPVNIQGIMYNYFVLWASQKHINELAASLRFL
ncbi:WD40 repeat domain-containing protein [Oceanobacillus sp. CFH 90083]|uniref:WD40 repeat domain-containing protein n=1 Tax=Oceanobacillus sp. CFH 90083 TaxID=2592336 RepID=UPI001D13E90C|nr:hypothetical protein [Oceanobacillus sp. CFH 90083]